MQCTNTHTLRTRFAKRLREHRLRSGFSQEELAERCGLHRTYIGSVERGERNISIDNIERIAESLGVSASMLLEE
ncbi:helix-turn-helix domain-containing protein [Paraburkholderia ribeironis]|nr:helix-turn-helix transcriptional regulator [Paraburkholderia ribeironis]